MNENFISEFDELRKIKESLSTELDRRAGGIQHKERTVPFMLEYIGILFEMVKEGQEKMIGRANELLAEIEKSGRDDMDVVSEKFTDECRRLLEEFIEDNKPG